jgi:hypothetical protein
MLIAIHLMCAATAAAISIILIRAWRASASPMQLHTAICFGLLGVVNVLVVLQKEMQFPSEMVTVRLAVSVVAVGFLVYGVLIKER